MLWCPAFRQVGRPLRLIGLLARECAGKAVEVSSKALDLSGMAVRDVRQDFALVDPLSGRFHRVGTNLLTRRTIPAWQAVMVDIGLSIPREFRHGVSGTARGSMGTIATETRKRPDRTEQVVGCYLRFAVGPRWMAVLVPPADMPVEAAELVAEACAHRILLCAVGEPRWEEASSGSALPAPR